MATQTQAQVGVSFPLAQPTLKRLHANHITTSTFLKPAPVFCTELFAGRDVQALKVYNKNLFNPMNLPTWGHLKSYNRLFFVPFRTIFADWNDYITTNPVSIISGGSTTVGLLTSTHTINNACLLNVILNYDTQQGTAASHDFEWYDGTNSRYIQLSDEGAFVLKVLEGLGYKIRWDDRSTKVYSALPLMAFIKVILDWYQPSSYAMNAVAANWDAMFRSRQVITFTNMNYQPIIDFFDTCCYCTYENDYFTSCWDNPTGPNLVGQLLPVALPDVTNNASGNKQVVTNQASAVAAPGSAQSKPNNGTPFVGSNTSSATNNAFGVVTQNIIDCLRSLTDWTRRLQLSGVRSIDRYFTEYGFNLQSELLKRSLYLGEDEFDNFFSDVMSYSDTANTGGQTKSGATLGSFAGKGNGYSEKVFTFMDNQEFGMLILVNSLIPEVGYYQGEASYLGHTTPMDFYHGDFDHVSVRAIPKGEVYVPDSGSDSNSQDSVLNGVFGFAPTYSEYLNQQSYVTGNIRLATRSTILDSFHLNRNIADYIKNGSPFSHNYAFVIGSDGGMYNRIFQYQQDLNITEFFDFDIEYSDKSLDLWDIPDFQDAANKVTINVGGTKLR